MDDEQDVPVDEAGRPLTLSNEQVVDEANALLAYLDTRGMSIPSGVSTLMFVMANLSRQGIIDKAQVEKSISLLELFIEASLPVATEDTDATLVEGPEDSQ